MNILTVDNKVFNIDQVPNLVDDIRYCVLEYNTEDTTDFYYKSLLFLESFNDSKIVLKIGNNQVSLPQEWSLVCGDVETGDLELIDLMSLNERDFEALVFNPITGYRLDFSPVSCVGYYQDIKWFSPRLGLGQMLAVPITESDNPSCVFVTQQQQNKVPEILNIEWLL